MSFQQTGTPQLWMLDVGCWMLDVPDHRRQRFRVNHARTQNLRRADAQIQYGGLDADLRLSAIHDEGDFPSKLRADVFRVRRRNALRQVRARRGERETAFTHHGLNERMTRP